jgi:hypothetical protein
MDSSTLDVSPPAYFSDWQVREWTNLITCWLDECDELYPADLALVQRYVEQMTFLNEIEAEIDFTGLMVVGQAGNDVVNPLLASRNTVANSLLSQFKAIEIVIRDRAKRSGPPARRGQPPGLHQTPQREGVQVKGVSPCS